MSSRSRRGFTLLELILALSLTGAAMLGAVLLLDQLDDGTARIVARRADTDREANGARLLRWIIFEAHVSPDTMLKFVGDDRSASFQSLCDVPGGWSEPCDATLTIDDRGDSSAIVADLSIGGSLVLRRGATRQRVEIPRRDTEGHGMGDALVVRHHAPGGSRARVGERHDRVSRAGAS